MFSCGRWFSSSASKGREGGFHFIVDYVFFLLELPWGVIQLPWDPNRYDYICIHFFILATCNIGITHSRAISLRCGVLYFWPEVTFRQSVAHVTALTLIARTFC